MNFADILEQWEQQQKHISRKAALQVKKSGKSGNTGDAHGCAEVQKSAQKEKCVNPMDLWIRRYGVVDKDAEFKREEEKRRFSNETSVKKMPIEAKLDLHGLTREEAWTSLDSFITECSRRTLKKVLIVHGKGNHSAEEPVLKDTVRAFIEKDTRLGASGHPAGTDGGRGATWVIIRTNTMQLEKQNAL